MKKNYVLIIFILSSYLSQAQNPNDFIMTYEVNNDTGLYVQYPFHGDSFTIDLGDGNTLTEDDVNVSGIHHTYSAPGIYTITVNGSINRVNFANTGYYTNLKVKSIEQWGTAQWISMEESFKNCQNMVVNATDIPDLSLVTSTAEMFSDAHIFNSPIDNWDVSQVTLMNDMFYGAELFNQPLSSWDVSNVTNMQNMFGRADAFNQNIDNWDVSNVTNMGSMFGFFPEDTPMFNQPLNNWDVSSVTDMYWMFRNNESFNQPISNWDVSNVTEMGYMFRNASSYNQPMENWDVTNVNDMSGMFNGASAFNQPLNDWVFENTWSINEMFSEASSFNQPLDNWDISNVFSINGLFHHATAFNQDISSWDFNEQVDLNSPSFGNTFLSFTAMDTNNYDALLLNFAQSGLQNKTIIAEEVSYCDASVRSYLINEKGWNFVQDSLGLECDFYNLTGSVVYDYDSNGCDSNDLPVNNTLIKALNNDFDYGTAAVNGNYELQLTAGTYTLSLLNIPDYFDATPTITSIFLDETNTTETVDFCLTANQTISDINTTIIAINEARPGFEATYQLVIKNIGTEPIDNVITSLSFNDTKQTFVESSPNPSETTNSSLNFDLGTIQPFETRYINVTLQTFAPPTVEGDDILILEATTLVTNDATPNDNNYQLEQLVVNSFDPNDKQVMQGSEIFIDDVEEYLDYIIRFQNTGTASAINVRLVDVLDNNLDFSTLLPLSASDTYSLRITNENELEFDFENINLPAQTVSETESQGYVAFKIKPKANVELGDFIIGNAAIYFDFNTPIITNTVQTEIIETLSTNEFSVNTMKVFPNPTHKNLVINSSKETISIIEIHDISGKLLLSFNDINSLTKTINLSKLNQGLYMMRVNENQVYKIIKN
ncbi:BspA family leucine-rich repeat surface protein [Psychroserpens luteus]|uniref:BspA family leucine-rich repeat surface protein n=1 Tax=Psychroserpens luteus TaxID=1434066 RepID=A0ABW5ZV87_9FLAO|nr:BspA family leucine-rich repeat surface protein [Psychroserpens luteus]